MTGIAASLGRPQGGRHDRDRILQQRLDALARTVGHERLGLGAPALALGVIGLASWTLRDPDVLRAQRFEVIDESGENTGAFGLRAIGKSESLLRLSSGERGEHEATEWKRSLPLHHDAQGPRITGVDPEGALKIDLR